MYKLAIKMVQPALLINSLLYCYAQLDDGNLTEQANKYLVHCPNPTQHTLTALFDSKRAIFCKKGLNSKFDLKRQGDLLVNQDIVNHWIILKGRMVDWI